MMQHKLTFNQILAGVVKENPEQLVASARAANNLALQNARRTERAAHRSGPRMRSNPAL